MTCSLHASCLVTWSFAAQSLSSGDDMLSAVFVSLLLLLLLPSSNIAYRISAVRGEADGWSLLLLDELGTGTDPTEGAALGQALLKAVVRGEEGRAPQVVC